MSITEIFLAIVCAGLLIAWRIAIDKIEKLQKECAEHKTNIVKLYCICNLLDNKIKEITNGESERD